MAGRVDEADNFNTDGGHLTGHLSHVSWDDRIEYLMEQHALSPGDDPSDLLQDLEGLVILDLGLASGKRAKTQRQEVAKAARAMKREARKIREDLCKLRCAMRTFRRAIGTKQPENFRPWAHTVLVQIFDVASAAPSTLEVPPGLEVLRALNVSYHDWLPQHRLLRELGRLPIRPRIATGPVPDITTTRALDLCRSFWTGLGRPWSRGNLEEAAFRDVARGAKVELLDAPAARFAADCLCAAGIPFTLKRLNSAFVAIGTETASPPRKN